jgi:GNAT superfamily N-acetyltransferase
MKDDILFVLPPMHHPGLPDPAGRRAMLIARSLELRSGMFDAGQDFFRRFVLDADQLRQTLAVLKQRWLAGELAQADEATRALAQQMLSQEQTWPAFIAKAPAVATGLRSESFFDPAQAAGALLDLDRMLALVSAAFYPCRFSRSGFHHAGLNSLSDLRAFIDHNRWNPLAQWARTVTLPADDLPASGLVMILVTRAGQVAPAASLLAAWSRRQPAVHLAACGDPQWVEMIHAAAGVAWPGDCPRPVAARWEAFQSHWVKQSAPDPGMGDGDGFLMPPGLHPVFTACPLQADAAAQCLETAQREPGQTIVWIDPQGELKSLTRQLFAAARQGGCWNHLVLPEEPGDALVEGLIEFAGANPNIIHSWSRRGPASSRLSDAPEHLPRGSALYGRTAPLPGIPLWQVLGDPIYITAYRRRWDTHSLMQLRYDPDEAVSFALGEQLRYHYVPPADLPEGYLDEICRMVEAGGSVGTQWLRHNLERAYLIAYVEERGIIAGNSSLKHPRQEYIDAVSAQSGLDLHDYLERGYTSVRPEYRGFGIGARLLEGLTERATGYKIFSIISEDNVATQKMAMRNRTRKVATFMSRKVGKQVGVWIPEWMLPEGIDLPPQPEFGDHSK